MANKYKKSHDVAEAQESQFSLLERLSEKPEAVTPVRKCKLNASVSHICELNFQTCSTG